MRVLHLPESFFPAKGGGKEVYTLRLAQGLQRLGVQNRIAIHGGDDSTLRYDVEGIEVLSLPSVVHRSLYTNRYSRIVDELPGFEAMLRDWAPDVVHFHDQNNGASLSHLRIVKARGIKAIVTFHTPGQVCPQHALLHDGHEICDGRLDEVRCTACQLRSFFGVPKALSALIAILGRSRGINPRSRLAKLFATGL